MQLDTQVRRRRGVKRLLHRVLDSLRFSLANYLQFATPRSNEDTRRLTLLIARVADGHRETSQRIAEFLASRRYAIRSGVFPKRFTAFNDLAVVYVAQQVVKDQLERIRLLQNTLASVAHEKAAHSLVGHILAEEREHTRVLRNECERLSGTIPLAGSSTVANSIQRLGPKRNQRQVSDAAFTRNVPQQSRYAGLARASTLATSDVVGVHPGSTTARTASLVRNGFRERVEPSESLADGLKRNPQRASRCRSEGDTDIGRWLDEGGAAFKNCCAESCE
jgi:hypothetical protein